MEEQLAAADDRLVRIVDASLAEAARRSADHLACAAGCAECCIGPFPINHLDARRLQRGLREIRAVDAAKADRVVQRAREAALAFAPDFPGDLSTGYFGEEPGVEAVFAERFATAPCPALDPESALCEIYEHRPIPCRTFGPPLRIGSQEIEPCRLCFTEASEEVVEAARVTLEAPECEELRRVERGLDQTVIAFALAFAPDD